MTHYVFEEDSFGSVIGYNVGRANISIDPLKEGVWSLEFLNGSELELYLEITTSPETTALAVAAAASSVVKGMVCDLTLAEFAQAVQALLLGL